MPGQHPPGWEMLPLSQPLGSSRRIHTRPHILAAAALPAELQVPGTAPTAQGGREGLKGLRVTRQGGCPCCCPPWLRGEGDVQQSQSSQVPTFTQSHLARDVL